MSNVSLYGLIMHKFKAALVFMIFYPETEPLRADAYNWGLPLPANHDGDFSADETEVVTDSHISMPTVDDVSTDLASNNELPDYSNDEDITIYDV